MTTHLRKTELLQVFLLKRRTSTRHFFKLIKTYHWIVTLVKPSRKSVLNTSYFWAFQGLHLWCSNFMSWETYLALYRNTLLLHFHYQNIKLYGYVLLLINYSIIYPSSCRVPQAYLWCKPTKLYVVYYYTFIKSIMHESSILRRTKIYSTHWFEGSSETSSSDL